MNSPIDGADAPRSESGPKHGRKRPGGHRKRKRDKNSNASERATHEPSSITKTGPEHSGQGKNWSGSKQHRAKNGAGDSANRGKKQGRPGGSNPLFAALDLGTNNCRLLIATPQQRGRFRVVDGYSRIVRLGEGLSQTGRLGDDAMDRAVEALKICARKLRDRKIRNQRLIATEACRQAENGELFLKRVRDETGLDLEIVSREMEAHLAAEGCGALMDRRSDGAVLFDIGGGSSELILVDRTNRERRKIKDQIVAWTSLPMGVVTLAENFGGRDVSRELFEEMVAAVSKAIDEFPDRGKVDHIFQGGNAHLLGTSGTVTTLAGIHLELPKYDRRQVDGLWMRDSDIGVIIDRLIDMKYEERAANPCIGKERADLVLAGCAILNAIRNTWPSDRLRVADRGLREGLLTEMMYKDGSWIRKKKNRWSRKRRMKRANTNGQAGE